MKEKILKQLRETAEMVDYKELELFVSNSLDEYADWKIKECLPKKIMRDEKRTDLEFVNGWNDCIDQILSNKDKK